MRTWRARSRAEGAREGPGGEALGHRRHPSSRAGPALPHPEGRGQRLARATARLPSREPRPTSPARSARPPPPATHSPGAGSRGLWLRPQLGGHWGRGSSRCECRPRPPGGSSGKGDAEKEAASAPVGRGGRGPSRSGLWRPKLRRGCAQDAF